MDIGLSFLQIFLYLGRKELFDPLQFKRTKARLVEME
jgi:hypothetical protein